MKKHRKDFDVCILNLIGQIVANTAFAVIFYTVLASWLGFIDEVTEYLLIIAMALVVMIGIYVADCTEKLEKKRKEKRLQDEKGKGTQTNLCGEEAYEQT